MKIDSLVPGFLAAMDKFPGTAHAYRNLGRQIDEGTLSARSRAQIALLVAQQLGGEYCLWALTRLAEGEGLNSEDVVFACVGSALARREAEVLKLVCQLIGGGVLRTPRECRASARFSDAESAEIFAQVAFAILVCYVIQSVAPRTHPAKRTA